MRPLALLILCAAASPALAGDAKLNTLTPREAADGWISLFDGETTFGWTIEGPAAVKDGALVLGGEAATKAVVAARFGAKFTLSFEARPHGRGATQHTHEPGYRVHSIPLSRPGAWTTEQVHWPSLSGSWGDGSAVKPAPVIVWFQVPAGGKVEVRNVKLRPLDLKAAFNGKDLTGWKVFDDPKRNRSRFTVADGAITVKDGPGDLQTEAKFGDFILQMECKSNGKHLNSGVFFRCRPNEYQNGYEAQINNWFAPDTIKEYTVERYDPKTHQLIAKDKVKSAAFDYGTGAIYRRVPARSSVAKDGEWFTLTVAAHGNRFATWVNGIQQVDWTDDRPPSDNARTGYRREAGHISIQGHDPTTDLSFRNIRIAELPPAK